MLFVSFRYHIYKQNQVRLNNNNSTRVDLNNVNRPAAPAVQPPGGEAPANAANADVNEANAADNNAQSTEPSEHEPLVAPTEPTVQEEPQVPLLTIVRTFVLSFFSSIIPEAPAL